MAIKQKFLSQDGTKNKIFYPITDTNAVYDKDGIRLSETLDLLQSQYYNGLDVQPSDSKYFSFVNNNTIAINKDIVENDHISQLVIPPFFINPNTNQKHIITNIGSNFDNMLLTNTTVTKIILPNTITTLADYSFANFTNLKTYICFSIITINDQAFKNCSNLTSITFPNTLTTIDSYAFKGCSNLQNIFLPNLQCLQRNIDDWNQGSIQPIFPDCTNLKIFCYDTIKNSSQESLYKDLCGTNPSFYYGYENLNENLSFNNPSFTGNATLNGNKIATETYVNTALSNIDIPQINLDGSLVTFNGETPQVTTSNNQIIALATNSQLTDINSNISGIQKTINASNDKVVVSTSNGTISNGDKRVRNIVVWSDGNQPDVGIGDIIIKIL